MICKHIAELIRYDFLRMGYRKVYRGMIVNYETKNWMFSDWKFCPRCGEKI